MGNNRLSCIRRRLTEEGFTEDVLDVIIQAYKVPSDHKGTLRSYQNVWAGFVEFCGEDSDRALEFRREDCANFATKLFREGASGSAVDAAITALDSTRAVILPLSAFLGQDRVMASIRKSKDLTQISSL